MKKLFTVIISIIMTITAIATIFVFSISHTTSKKTVSKMIKQVNTQELLEETNIKDDLYETAQNYQISKNQVDDILSSNEVKEYLSTLIAEIIDNNLNHTKTTKEKIEQITSTFINEVTKTYKIDITEDEKQNISTNITDNITENVNQADTINTDFTNIINTLTNINTKIFLIILLIIEATFIILLAWKDKNFFNYFGVINLIVTITVVSVVFIFKLGITTIFKKETIIINLFNPLISNGYKLSFILLIITVIFFIIHLLIKKYIVNVKEIPF